MRYTKYATSITMLLALDNSRMDSFAMAGSTAAYLNINGRTWQSNPTNKSSEFTSACFLSNLCSFLGLASPPQKREDPRTRRRFKRMEPKREYFSTKQILVVYYSTIKRKALSHPDSIIAH